ncbi:MAG: hypothetical protein CMI02_15620 [Oceanospirillaceae bacterium]|nr:hypothetical protein [Oceanospirillaceae bacterium]MBT13450.1 hypothetical protein [Oceanospirillaceae bacterium]|tara:strand:- start:29537 stop:29968 length:432 start_codon:yes stop_codon:yes gene_type:complete
MMTQTRRFSLYSMFTALLLSPLASADILIDDPYVREPVPGRNMSAAFMSVRNTAAEDAVLVSASAPWAGKIEIHTHRHEDGVMKMRQIESLTIPAGGQVLLKPMGLHLMLFRLQQPLADSLPLTLCFASGACVDTVAELRKPQ